MYRIILFLLLIALAAAGAAWVADQPGEIVLSWNDWRVHATLPVFALGLGIAIVAAMVAWSVLRGLWRLPEKSDRLAMSGVMREAGTRSRKDCWRSATAIRRPRAPMPMSRAAMPRAIR